MIPSPETSGAEKPELRPVRAGGIDHLVAASLERSGIHAVFTGRHRGASSDPCSSLNLSFDVGDARGDVIENRKRVGRIIGRGPESWVLGRQVHGANVRVVGILEKGRGGMDCESALPRTDGLVTGRRGLAIGVLTADCVPVILAAPAVPVVAVAHAGWRGMAALAPAAVLEKLLEFARCGASDVVAYIGPHVCRGCFEVGAEVADLFEKRFVGVVDRADGGHRVDLSLACRQQLESRGMSPSSIIEAEDCTLCRDGYFSFRRDAGVTGRQAAMVVIDGTGA